MSAATSLDGRTARRLENRQRILDAALELIAEGDEEVSSEAIAERAGVSVRSVYNHFPSARHLIAGMYERGAEQVRPLLDEMPSPADPFGERVHRWIRLRCTIQERIAAVRWRALVAEERHPELQPELAALRKAHKAEVRRLLPEVTDDRARAAIVALTDSLSWRALRHHQGLSFDAACDAIEETIRRLSR
jgi:AcrR family transcriptional regulator